jgi:TfoX/Sxy family transcriptional regulator of competence genes
VTDTTERKWRAIANSELAQRGVTSGTGFGRSEGLRVFGKIFAMLVRGELVVKLPRARVEELVAAGLGEPFDAGHGRVMKEWITLEPSTSRRWRSLVAEAHDFVASTATQKRNVRTSR